MTAGSQVTTIFYLRACHTRFLSMDIMEDISRYYIMSRLNLYFPLLSILFLV